MAQKCWNCGSENISEDNGQFFCMDCGFENPAPSDDDFGEAEENSESGECPEPEKKEIDENKKHKIWMRVGMSVQLSVAELRKIDEGDMGVLRDAIKNGFAEPDGDGYIPDSVWDDDKILKDEIPDELKHEINFNL
jgi:hypothetical protein